MSGWAFSVTVIQQAARTTDQSQARVESGATFRYTQLDLESIASLDTPCWRTPPLPKQASALNKALAFYIVLPITL